MRIDVHTTSDRREFTEDARPTGGVRSRSRRRTMSDMMQSVSAELVSFAQLGAHMRG
jgi:hypothetical protein